MSGMFDMKPVRLSKRSSYINFSDAMKDAMSAERHILKINAPVVLTSGTTRRRNSSASRDFAAKLQAAGNAVQTVSAPNFNHFEMCESLGNPYGPNGRAAPSLVGLA